MIRLFGGKKDTEAASAAGEADAAETEARPGFFERMRQAVSRTRESFASKIADIAAMTRIVDESALEELETALLSSDLGVPTTTAVLDALRDHARHQEIDGGEELRRLLKAQLKTILEAPQRPLSVPDAPPKVTFLVGVNGTGKPPAAASWRRGAGRRGGRCCSARQIRFGPRQSNSLKCGLRARAWK